jgi:hypothetical protein
LIWIDGSFFHLFILKSKEDTLKLNPADPILPISKIHYQTQAFETFGGRQNFVSSFAWKWK